MRFLKITLILACSSVLFSNPSSAQCDSALWAHVYHSYRLVVNTQCMYVTGVVTDYYTEADGDWHIRLQLDSPYTYMLNSANISDEYGDLVCEPICLNTITQTDAIAPCAGTAHPVYIPTSGEHVTVLGSYVTDNDHGWNEIHPVTSITPYGTTGITNVGNDNVEMEVYPNPAPAYVNFRLKDPPSSPVYITILDDVGRLAGQFQMIQQLNLRVPTIHFPAGTYHYHIEQENKYIKGGTFEVVR